MSFVVSPYTFAVAGGPAGDVVFAVQDFVTGTATGAQNFTSATITGVTPKAALVIGALHDPTNDPGETPGLSLAIGSIVSTGDGAVRVSSEDAGATTDTLRLADATRAYLVASNTSASIKAASGQVVSGGIELNFTTNTAPSLRSYFTAFAGADTSGSNGVADLGNNTTPIDISSLSFEPDAVLFFGAQGTSTVFANGLLLTFGIAVNDGADTQRCVLWGETDALADSRPFQTLRNDCAIGKISDTDGSLTYKHTIGTFDATGFTMTPSAAAGGDDSFFLALNFGGRQFKLVDFDTPTTTGSHTITGAGFTPQFALAVVTNLEAVNSHPGTTSDNQSGLSICAIGDEQWSASWRINAAEATADTASQVTNAALMGASATDCDAILATFTAWTSNGVTLNFSAVQASAKKGFILFIE